MSEIASQIALTKENIEKIVKKNERLLNKKITWYSLCNFYANSSTKKIFNNVLIFLTDIMLYVKGDDFEESFKVLDIYYTETVLKNDVLSYLSGNINKVKRVTIFNSMGKEKMLSLELEDKSFRFIDVNILEFRQILNIAQAKQKYSRSVNSMYDED